MDRNSSFRRLVLPVVVLALLSSGASSQALSELESRIAKSIMRIEALRDSSRYAKSGGDKYDDSLSRASNDLAAYLIATLPKIPESLTAKLSLPKLIISYTDDRHEYAKVGEASPSDHMMRIYSWDTWTGGSMPALENIIEYRASTGIKACELSDAVGWDNGGNYWFDTIFITHARNGKTLYLPRATWKGDGRHSGRSIFAVTVEADTLNLTEKIFALHPEGVMGKQRGAPTSELSIGEEDCPIADLKLSPDGRVLYVQHIGYDKDGKAMLTNEWDIYKFDGEHFIYKGLGKQ